MKLQEYLQALKSCPDRMVKRGRFGVGDLDQLPMLTRDLGVYDNYKIFLKAELRRVAVGMTKIGFGVTSQERYLKNPNIGLRLDSPPQYLSGLRYLSLEQRRRVRSCPTEIIVSPTMPRGLGKDDNDLVEIVRNLANAVICIGDLVLKDNIPSCFLWFNCSPSRVVFYP